MRQIHLWREEAVEVDGLITISSTIEPANQEPHSLWYRFPSKYSSFLTHSCDPFVVATILMAMNQSSDLVVHGQVSPSLLRNLEEFQAAWSCWHPDRYHHIQITADIEREQMPSHTDKAIAAFSGGVDSCFSVFRHKVGSCGRLKRNLQAGLMVHGFDIPLAEKDVFNSAAAKSRTMLQSLGLELIPMMTNFRELPLDWEDAFGIATASCLMLLQGGYACGLIASSPSYRSLLLPYGSNPITDWLLSSDSFQIIHDGAGFSRLDKIQEIASWSAVLQNLRVCWQGIEQDRNCGKCEKCIRTILSFRVLGTGLPDCFERDVTDTEILQTRAPLAQIRADFEPILDLATQKNISQPWVKALERCISYNQYLDLIAKLKIDLKQRLPSVVLNQWQKIRR